MVTFWPPTIRSSRSVLGRLRVAAPEISAGLWARLEGMLSPWHLLFYCRRCVSFYCQCCVLCISWTILGFTSFTIFCVNFLKFQFQLMQHILCNVNKFPSQLMQHVQWRLDTLHFQQVHYVACELSMFFN